MRLLLVCALASAAPLGCAHSTPEARALERARRERCYTIELYPTGVTPPRPYRVLGPVSVDSDGNPAHRDRTLQERACQLQADAVIDVRDEAQRSAQPLYGAESRAEPVTSTGTAVAFTDVTPPAAPPVEPSPSPSPAAPPVEPSPSPSPSP